MKVIAIALLALLAVSAVSAKTELDAEYEFASFMVKYNKTYTHEEFVHRFAIFKANLAKIDRHNMLGFSHQLAVNAFADLTAEEFKATYLRSYPPQHFEKLLQGMTNATLDAVDLPTSVDWRTKNVVTPVKNQGQCGSCWAFSATGTVESAWALAKKALVSLSEQQLVDCSGAFGNLGCNGGWPHSAMSYIIQNKGICTETEYPYKAVTDSSCSACTPRVTISGFKYVSANNEVALKAAVAMKPVSVCVDAQSWQFYSGGILSSGCGTLTDHCVLAVGYGSESSQDYWLVKNSWGVSWGEEGYIRVLRGSGSSSPGVCGIAMFPTYPVV